MAPVEDDDYLSFGYWVRATTMTDEDGETSTSYNVHDLCSTVRCQYTGRSDTESFRPSDV